jgi:hypothetical protein
MKKYFTVLIILVLVSLLAVGCKETPSLAPTPSPAPTPAPTPAPAPAPAPVTTTGIDNFRLLISDDVNAIEGFEHLYVTITSVGVHQSGESGGWHILDPEPNPDGDNVTGIDLKPLVGQNALAIWSGTLPEGEYTKVFIYVESVKGILNGGAELEIKLPSGKLQISKPFTIGDDVVNFVYDITVIKTGKSDKYILKPQIAQSGADQTINEVIVEKEQEEPEDSEGELKLVIHGEPGPGAEVTLSVTDDGTPVEGASVTVNGEEAGSTDADGQLIILLPDTPGEIEIEATWGDKSGEIELDLEEQGVAESEWFEGTIISLNEGQENSSPWSMTLEGVEGQVLVYVVELEGTPSVGAWAEVEGVLVNNTIEDAKAKIEEED